MLTCFFFCQFLTIKVDLEDLMGECKHILAVNVTRDLHSNNVIIQKWSGDGFKTAFPQIMPLFCSSHELFPHM